MNFGSFMRNRGVATLLPIAIAATTNACSGPSHDHETTSQTSTAVTSAIDYPRVSSKWDSAIALAGDEREAAEFAAETQALDVDVVMSNIFDADAMLELNRRVAPGYGSSKATWDGVRGLWPTTGGTLSRVIRVEREDAGFEVTLCKFDSPGLYNIKNGVPTHDDADLRVISAEVFTVKNTMQPSAADKDVSSKPRLLVVSIVNAGKDNEPPGVLCDKFAPEPFIQTPPPPLPSNTGHK
ncbi:hypothetical protein [Nocardia africana]|uniref:Lipoprotein n=1 Tax=Nocardia africana TaxID=134964 RepID=A0ABW6NM29_9NOCA